MDNSPGILVLQKGDATSQLQQVEKFRVRYTRTNPPPDEETALETIDKLAEGIMFIEVQLDHVDPNAHPTDEQYDIWRKRAISALGYLKSESAFLERWIKRRKPVSIEQEVNIPKIGEAKKFAEEVASETRKLYAPVYSTQEVPLTMQDALERELVIKQLLSQCQIAFSLINAEALRLGIPITHHSLIKYPLLTLEQEIQQEFGIVKRHITEMEAQLLREEKQIWKQLCIHALSRAISEGFKLGPNEKKAFDKLKANLS